MPKFKIEQVALYPFQAVRALEFLKKIGLEDWTHDKVKALGYVHNHAGRNEANLAFNYTGLDHARELEVLDYTDGPNWMTKRAGRSGRDSRVSHLGMHVTAEELADWRLFMMAEGVSVAQEVFTDSHTNPVIAGKRRYNYVIFDTFDIIGVDLKFIVRIDIPQVADEKPTPPGYASQALPHLGDALRQH